MSWDQSGNYGGDGYGNYGEYNDQQYGGQQQQQYDSFSNQGSSGQQQQQQQYQQQPGFNNSSSSFYNPQDYQGQQQQQGYPQQNPGGAPQYQQQQQPGMQNAYRSSPLPQQQQQPYGQGQQQPAQQPQPGGYSIPGLEATGVNPVMANMAMQYGQDFVGKGGEELKKNLEQYVSIGQLKYYFAVDTSYVGKKLGLLMFPFTHRDWSIRYNQDEPVQPKYDVNAPDLYIPSMAYVTYILIVGYILGLRNAFSPDLLGTTAGSVFVWLVLELGCIYLSMTLMNISTNLCKWDILSFSTYKYVAMIAILLAGLVLQTKTGYYVALVYVSGALAFFLVRTLKLRIEPEVHGMQVHGKRKLYLLLFYSGLQPLLIWWMTSYLVPISSSILSASASGGSVPPLGDIPEAAMP